jgi:hypothetical protein
MPNMKGTSAQTACNAVGTAALQARHLVSINGDPVPRKKSWSRGTSRTSTHDTPDISMKTSNSLHEIFLLLRNRGLEKSNGFVSYYIYCGKKEHEEFSGGLILIIQGHRKRWTGFETALT